MINLKTVKVGFLMGLGLGLMISSIILFIISMTELNGASIKDTKAVELPKTNTVIETPQNTVKIEEKKPAEVSSEEDKYVTIKIPNGSDSYSITKILFDHYLINNEKDFNKYLEKQNKSTKLSAGTFKIKLSSSYDEIIDKLTNKN